MKKLLLLLLAFPLLALQCEQDEAAVELDCQCYKETVYINNGTEIYLVRRDSTNQSKCDNWGYGYEYLPINDSSFHQRFIEICE